MASEDEIQIEGIETIETPLLVQLQRDEDETGNEEFNEASFTGAVLNLSTTIIGAGIMALPATMKILGLIPGIAMIILMAFLTDKTIEFLLRFSRIGKQRSYAGLMEDSFGRPGRIVLQVTVLLSNIGVLIVYMIIIGDVLSGKSIVSGIHHAGMLRGWFGGTWWKRRICILLVTTLTFIAPLTLYRRIDSLKVASAISLGLAVLFLVITARIVVMKYIYGGLVNPRLVPNLTDLSSLWKLFTVVPVTQNELGDATQIKPVVRVALTMCSFVYIMTSLFGYLLFGESTLDDVLANFDTDLKIPHGWLLNEAVRFSYAFHLILVFPIVFHPLRVHIDGLLFPTTPSLTNSNLRFFPITAGLIAAIFLGANFIPSIWDAFQLTGATTSACIGFIFPAAVILKDRHNRETKRDKFLATFVILLAVFSSVIAIYSDVDALYKKNRSTIPMWADL